MLFAVLRWQAIAGKVYVRNTLSGKTLRMQSACALSNALLTHFCKLLCNAWVHLFRI